MSTENIEKFTAALATNPALSAKVQALRTEAAQAAAEGLAALSVEAGAPFTAEEYLAVFPPSNTELSEEALGSVSGGVIDFKKYKSPFEN